LHHRQNGKGKNLAEVCDELARNVERETWTVKEGRTELHNSITEESVVDYTLTSKGVLQNVVDL
jgi:hypothetical protein